MNKAEAEVQNMQAQTMLHLINAGFSKTSVVEAVTKGDLNKLEQKSV